MEEFSTEKISDWNTAQQSAYRLAKWIEQSNISAAQHDMLAWRDCLLIVYREVYPKLNDKERESVNEIIKKINRALSSQQQMVKEAEDGDEMQFTELPERLNELDLRLRDLADSKNLLFPDQKDVGKAIFR